jgi:hypothetical protein
MPAKRSCRFGITRCAAVYTALKGVSRRGAAKRLRVVQRRTAFATAGRYAFYGVTALCGVSVPCAQSGAVAQRREVAAA